MRRVVSALVNWHGLTFSILPDPEQEMMDRYGITLIPTLFFIDRDGRIQGKYIGPREWRNAANWRLIERLLGQK